jgi:hypothetical protein
MTHQHMIFLLLMKLKLVKFTIYLQNYKWYIWTLTNHRHLQNFNWSLLSIKVIYLIRVHSSLNSSNKTFVVTLLKAKTWITDITTSYTVIWVQCIAGTNKNKKTWEHIHQSSISLKFSIFIMTNNYRATHLTQLVQNHNISPHT